MVSKQLRSLIPYIPIIVISVGLIKHIVFYKFFGIEVIEYISLNEILVLFAEDLFVVFVFLFLLFVLVYLTSNSLNASTLSEEEQIQLKKAKQKIFKPLFITYLIVVTLVYILILIKFKYSFSLFGFAIFLLQLTPALTLYYILIYKEKYNTNSSKDYVFFITLSFYFLIYTTMIATFEADNTQKGKYFGTKLITADSTYTSDSNHYYIGKTDKYVFIYNESDSTSTVLPTSEIKRFIIKEKP